MNKTKSSSRLWSLVAGIAVSLAFAPAHEATAHRDVGLLQLNDWVYLTRMDARTDQDDGGGESEYCIRITKSHTGHGLMDGVRIICGDANWDDPNPDNPGTAWNESSPMRLPLVGTGGYLSSKVRLGYHLNECTPSNLWTYTVKVYEVDHTPAPDILRDLAKIIREHGADALDILSVPTAGQSTAVVNLAGASADFLARVVERLFHGETLLGTHDGHFDPGAADDGSTLKESGTLQHFALETEKTTSGPKGPCGSFLFLVGIDGINLVPTTLGPCFVSKLSPLCLNYGDRTRQQYQQLQALAERIAGVEPEAGTAATDTTAREVQKSLIELTGGVARLAASHQLKVAREAADADIPALIEVIDRFESANRELRVAIEEASADSLIRAISGYEAVQAALAPRSYGPAFAERWQEAVIAGFDRNSEFAKVNLAANDKTSVNAALGYLLNQYQHLPKATRTAVNAHYEAEYGVNLAAISALPTVDQQLVRFAAELGP